MAASSSGKPRFPRSQGGGEQVGGLERQPGTRLGDDRRSVGWGRPGPRSGDAGAAQLVTGPCGRDPVVLEQPEPGVHARAVGVDVAAELQGVAAYQVVQSHPTVLVDPDEVLGPQEGEVGLDTVEPGAGQGGGGPGGDRLPRVHGQGAEQPGGAVGQAGVRRREGAPHGVHGVDRLQAADLVGQAPVGSLREPGAGDRELQGQAAAQVDQAAAVVGLGAERSVRGPGPEQRERVVHGHRADLELAPLVPVGLGRPREAGPAGQHDPGSGEGGEQRVGLGGSAGVVEDDPDREVDQQVATAGRPVGPGPAAAARRH